MTQKGQRATSTESIEGSGFPLAFKARQGKARAGVIRGEAGRDLFGIEARQFAGHQKEAVVTEGESGSAWRMVSDEGAHIKGTDLAPFPLGYFNAGLHGDLINRILAGARARDLPVSDVRTELTNGYYMTGSFFRGNGKGHIDSTRVKVRLSSAAPVRDLEQLVSDAAAASPALAALRLALTNTFALYVNGRRRKVTTMPAAHGPDAADPFLTYGRAPSPLGDAREYGDIIRKTGDKEAGTPSPAPSGTATRIIRNIAGHSRLLDAQGMTETDTWLQLPGTSHFAIRSDERASGDQAPCGLALLSAGIVFCFMTQISRYIEHMKFNIWGVRLVQLSPYTLSGSPDDGKWAGGAEPVETHLFLNGEENEETCERLMAIAANTCYLHATLGTSLEPEISVEPMEMALP